MRGIIGRPERREGIEGLARREELVRREEAERLEGLGGLEGPGELEGPERPDGIPSNGNGMVTGIMRLCSIVDTSVGGRERGVLHVRRDK